MAVLEPGRPGLPAALAFKPLPSQAAVLAEPEGAQGLVSQLVPAAALTLGLSLAVGPSLVLGSLLHTSGESVVGALLETVVYGEGVQAGGGHAARD